MIDAVAQLDGTWDLAVFACPTGGSLTMFAGVGNRLLNEQTLKGVLAFKDGKSTFDLNGEFRILMKFTCHYTGTFDIALAGKTVVVSNLKGKDTSGVCPLPIFPYGDGDRFLVELEKELVYFSPLAAVDGNGPSKERVGKVNSAYCGSSDKAQLQYKFVLRKKEG